MAINLSHLKKLCAEATNQTLLWARDPMVPNPMIVLAEEAVPALIEALEKYGFHLTFCKVNVDPVSGGWSIDAPCTCGWSALLDTREEG